MSCCGPKGASGGCCPPPAGGSEGYSRYPALPQQVEPGKWCRAPPPAHPQFGDGFRADSGAPPPYTYTGEHLAACNFPLGGIGSGQCILQGDGTLQGWTVINQADNKGDMAAKPTQDVCACFFGISAQPQGGTAQSFALATPANYTEENRRLPSWREAHVTEASVRRMEALPGIQGLTLVGRYPVAELTYDVPGLPVEVSLEAMSPLVPGVASDSAFPGAIFTFTVRNPGKTAVDVRLMEAQQNFVGWDGGKAAAPADGKASFWHGNVNTPFTDTASGAGGLAMSGALTATDAHYGTLCVVGTGGAARVIPGVATEDELWAAFVAKEDVAVGAAAPTPPSASGVSYAGGVVQQLTVPAGATKTATFVLAWHFPNRPSAWGGADGAGNHYAAVFADAKAVAVALSTRYTELTGATRAYRDAMYGSTLPPTIIDSAAGRAALMGCPTMWITKAGIVQGFEGNHCCNGNCSHVYGYTVLIERLFPELAQDMHYSSFVRTYNSKGGGVMMRWGNGWAIDGALATIIKAYLAVRQGDGTLTWLPKVWPNIKDQIDLINTNFAEADGCIRKAQGNTYDSSMNQANTFIGSYYVAALRAVAMMADLMGEPALAKDCRARAEVSSTSYEKICWKEDFGYYIADVDASNCGNSYGPGCFIDQVCATALAYACDLGPCFDPAHEARARASINRHNVVHTPPFKDFQHHFFPGDSGHVTCTYPNGKLKGGMKYDTLVSAGWNYPVVAGLLYDRNVDDALSMVAMIRQRHDGRNRACWNEPECNTHYSRQMSAWNVFDQACGLRYDATKKFLAYDPRINATDFHCFFHAEGGWGTYAQKGASGLATGTLTLSVLYGTVTLAKLGAASSATGCTVTQDGKAVAASLSTDGEGGITITFAAPVVLNKGSVLTCALTSKDAAVAVYPAAGLRHRTAAPFAPVEKPYDEAGARKVAPAVWAAGVLAAVMTVFLLGVAAGAGWSRGGGVA